MEIGVTKLRKGGNGAVIVECETEEEKEKLKVTIHETLDENYKVTEPHRKKPKIKILNVGEDEMKLNDDKLLDIIKT